MRKLRNLKFTRDQFGVTRWIPASMADWIRWIRYYLGYFFLPRDYKEALVIYNQDVARAHSRIIKRYTKKDS